ncbi:fluoride efflux transporter CrcB [Marilutibacter aestuarii]|uniref:Fluoride-specific ion channel FluC n=1 Tax=Marilutibacter aestuarii TaxID=1706195 RepID=A0A507ZSR2_9GAMM|nr:fluoride efflux transporter CrcB [Lysobacter aestuarii]TQD40846.1 fluoride efflux transporter CrcB [Lysobacter aestuarii]
MVSAVAVFIGAGLGALARWGLGVALNPVFPNLPLGTLAANVAGGLLMGVAMALFANSGPLSPALRLAVTTGFLGGLTTFSAFSAETVDQFMRGEPGWACLTIASHLLASLAATFLGVMLVRWAT